MISLRPSGFDELGLRRALSDRMLPLLVAAMAFLAALALAGWFGTAALSRHWQQGAGASLTVQVPQASEPAAHGGQTRLAAVLATLTATPGVASAHALSEQELADLLKPWLGQAAERLAIPIPAVIAVRLTDCAVDRSRCHAGSPTRRRARWSRTTACGSGAGGAGPQPAGLCRFGAAAGRRRWPRR